MYCSPSGSSAHGIPQEKILEWESSPGNLPNPAIKLGLLHCRRVLYHLSHQVRLNYPLKDPLSKYWCLLRLFGLGLKHTDLGRAHSAHQLLIYVPWDMGEAGRRNGGERIPLQLLRVQTQTTLLKEGPSKKPWGSGWRVAASG